MSTNGLLEKSRVEIKLDTYGVAPATALTDPTILPQVQEYRRRASSRLKPLDLEGLSKEISPGDYHVSRKVDGEFTVLVYRDGHAFSINPGGTIRVGLPWIEEAAKLLKKAKVSEAMIAGELYVDRKDRRPRVHDVSTVARQPQSKDDLQSLKFAVFDVISKDRAPLVGGFEATWQQIQQWFAKGKSVHPVEAVKAADEAAINKLFSKWVEDEGAEGLVIRSDTSGQFKVKPRHTLDAVVIGFTEAIDDRQGMLHDLLLAVMRSDGTLQVLSHVGGGFTEEQRRELLSDLRDLAVDSDYAEINSDHVAYQMVRPEVVVEISCLDLISSSTRGAPINRMVLDFSRNGSTKYRVVRRLPLVSVISPVFLRCREDKRVNPQDVRVQQVGDLVEVPLIDRDAREISRPASQILYREVYTKKLKGETMVRKFVMWATNKSTDSDEYPAYVIHYTDFSPNRQSPFSREIRVSNSKEQILSLWASLKEENIKKGWDLQSSFEDPSVKQ